MHFFILFLYLDIKWGPRKFEFVGRAEAQIALHQLAEWFGFCDFVAEREKNASFRYLHASKKNSNFAAEFEEMSKQP